MGNNFIWYLICFLLGCVIFFIFPKDYTASQYKAVQQEGSKQDGDCIMSNVAGQSATQVNCSGPGQ